MHTGNIFFVCLLAVVCTSISIFFLKPIAHYFGLLDVPGGRKQHAVSTPLIGGIAMFIGFSIAVIALNHSVKQSIAMLSGAAILIILGVFDDSKDIRKRTRLFGQVAATSILVIFGHLSVMRIGDLFFTGQITLAHHPVIDYFITLVAVLAFINATNMVDGIDGLAGLLALGQCTFFSIIAVQLGYMETAKFLFILVAILLTYLAFNLSLPWRKQASIFMGDAGSTFIAFIIAWFAVTLSQKTIIAEALGAGYNIITILWILALPLFDLLAVVYTRLKNKKSPVLPGRDHCHHLLLALNIKKTNVVWLMFLLSIFFGLLGIVFSKLHIIAAWQLIIFIGAFISYLCAIEYLRASIQKYRQNQLKI